MYTEDQARTKWCPFVRLHLLSRDVSYNRRLGTGDRMEDTGLPHGSHCIASECMAWRWKDGITPKDMGDFDPDNEAVGHCGLAGKP
jgi:hypothetical protein